MGKLQVGQELWWVWSNHRRGEPRTVKVEKVGRRWATLSNGYRIDIESLWADSGKYSSPGRCYLSKADHDAAATRADLWNQLRRKVEFGSVHSGVTIDDIREAARLLRVTLT